MGIGRENGDRTTASGNSEEVRFDSLGEDIVKTDRRGEKEKAAHR